MVAVRFAVSSWLTVFPLNVTSPSGLSLIDYIVTGAVEIDVVGRWPVVNPVAFAVKSVIPVIDGITSDFGKSVRASGRGTVFPVIRN